MAEGKQVGFNLDGLIDLARTVLDGFLSLFKPLLSFITRIAGSGTTGFLIVFVIFFLIWLLRMNASAKRADVFSHGLHYIGGHGLAVSGLYFVMMALERTLIPLLVVLLNLSVNTAVGVEPSFKQFFAYLSTPNSTNFYAAMVGFMLDGQSVLPLNLSSAILITAAFGCMWFIGRHSLNISDGAPGNA